MQLTLQDILEAINTFATHVDGRFAQMDERFVCIDERFARIDERFDQIDKRFAQMDERFIQIDKCFAQMDQQLVDVHREIKEIRSTMATKADLANLVSKEYLEGRLVHIR